MKIKISNLHSLTTLQDVKVLLEDYGEVKSVRLVSSGAPDSVSAIAVMHKADDADDAINDLHNERFDGRVLQVVAISEAEPDPDEWNESPWEDEEDFGGNKKWEKIQRKKPSRKSWQSD